MTSSWICLELGRAGPPEQLEQRRLDARQRPRRRARAAAARARGRARCASRPRRRPRAPRRRARAGRATVWLTHTCASIPQTSAWSRPPRSKPSARAAREDRLLEPLDALEMLATSGDRRAEALRVLLGDERPAGRGLARPASSGRRCAATPSKPSTAGRNASCTSTTTSAARSRSSIAALTRPARARAPS